MSDVDQINALSQVIRRIDGDHTMGAGALAEAILERRTEWDALRIIRTVKELEAEDPDTMVQLPQNEQGEWPRVISAESLQWAMRAWNWTPLPVVAIRDGEDVRAARKALEEA